MIVCSLLDCLETHLRFQCFPSDMLCLINGSLESSVKTLSCLVTTPVANIFGSLLDRQVTCAIMALKDVPTLSITTLVSNRFVSAGRVKAGSPQWAEVCIYDVVC